MRFSAYMLGIVILLMFHGSLSAQTNEPLEPIEIAIGEWKPFVTQTVDGYGEVTEIVTVVLERMGYRPKYIFMPWGQAEKLVRENESDIGPRATFPFTDTKKRRRAFFFSDKPVFERCINFFYNKDKLSQDIPISTIKEDLKEFKFGFVSEEGGYQYPRELTEVLTEHGTPFDNLFEAFNKLVDPTAEEVQVVPAILEVGEELLFELFPEQRFTIDVLKEAKVKNRNHCLVPAKYYFLASRRNPNNAELKSDFDKVHRNIDSETTARIKQKASERPSMRTPEVVLIARDSPGGITGRDDADDRIYYLPRGTRGLLLKWRPASGQQRNDSSIKAEVRVISGPYRGKTLFVDRKFVVLK